MTIGRDINPKDAVGSSKVPATVVPRTVLAEIALGMFEGARKYGRHNYRVVGIRASPYIDAAHRHLDAWWEGEDVDPDSGLSHLTKAITSLICLRDAMIQGLWTDDRPPAAPADWLAELNRGAAVIVARHPEPVEPYTESNKREGMHKP